MPGQSQTPQMRGVPSPVPPGSLPASTLAAPSVSAGSAPGPPLASRCGLPTCQGPRGQWCRVAVGPSGLRPLERRQDLASPEMASQPEGTHGRSPPRSARFQGGIPQMLRPWALDPTDLGPHEPRIHGPGTAQTWDPMGLGPHRPRTPWALDPKGLRPHGPRSPQTWDPTNVRTHGPRRPR